MFEILMTLSASLEICSRNYWNNGVLRLPVFGYFFPVAFLWREPHLWRSLYCITFLFFCCHFPLVFLEITNWGNFYSYLYFNVFSWSPNKIIMQIYTQLCRDNIFLGSYYPCFCHCADSLRTSLSISILGLY